MPITVKVSVGIFLFLCALQIAALVFAMQTAIPPTEDGVEYPYPIFSVWVSLSCATIPIVIVSGTFTLFEMFALPNDPHSEQRKNVRLLQIILISYVVFIVSSFLSFLAIQLLFVPPSGSS